MNTTDSVIQIKQKDAMFENAAKLVVNSQIGSTSLLQRKLKFPYGRACEVMRQMHTAGIVGEFNPSAAREVLIRSVDQLKSIFNRIENIT